MDKEFKNDSITIDVDNYFLFGDSNPLVKLIAKLEAVKTNLDKEHPEWNAGNTYIGHTVDKHGNLSLVINYDRFATEEEVREEEMARQERISNELNSLRELMKKYPSESKKMLSI